MNSFYDRNKYWLLSIVIICLVFVSFALIRALLYQDADDLSQREGQSILDSNLPDKPVTMEVMEQLEEDNSNLATALQTGGFEACEKIEINKQAKKDCIDQLIYLQAQKDLDLQQCEKISLEGLRQRCFDQVYYQSALARSRADLCDFIQAEDLRQTCGDELKLLQVTGDWQSLDPCDTIEVEALHEACMDQFYLSQMSQTQEVTLCDQFSTPEKQLHCQQTLEENQALLEAQQASIDEQEAPKSNQELIVICEDLNQAQRDICETALYNRLAFEERDLSYCSNISDPLQAQACQIDQGKQIDQYYLNTARAEKDLNLCQRILNEAVKSLCLNS